MLHSQPHGSRTSWPRWGAALVLLAWVLLQWFVRRHEQIVDDWAGWRAADTQTIARYFWRDGIDLLAPRIAWGGDGPGFVEAELQLFPALIALMMRVFGDVEWPGQLISLVSMAAAHWIIFRSLERRFGSGPGLFGAFLMITSKGSVTLATAVQPDALAFACYVFGWFAFSEYVDEGGRAKLWLATVMTAIAALVKPTMLSLGLSQFALVCLVSPRRLKNAELWLAWALVVVSVAAYLLHARTLYLEFGNTFGILSGGDTKGPKLEHLLMPGVWLSAFKQHVVYGTGAPAVVAALWLLVRRKVQRHEVALGLGSLSVLVVCLRYTSHDSWGTHYHIVSAPLGAWLLAHAAQDVLEKFSLSEALRRVSIVVATGIGALQYGHAAYRMKTVATEPEVALGQALSKLVGENDLVVVRARAPSYDHFWRTPNNYQDPRIFYLAKVKGWALPNDQDGSSPLTEYVQRGAKYYVEPTDADHSFPRLRSWLDRNARLVVRLSEGTIWRLGSPASVRAPDQKVDASFETLSPPPALDSLRYPPDHRGSSWVSQVKAA